MLKRAVNECRFTLVLTAKSPIIIKEGRWEKGNQKDKEKQKKKKENGQRLPDSIPIRRGFWHESNPAANVPSNNDRLPTGAEYYLPGTSIRGVLRSHAERIVRTVAPEKCCDPFQVKNAKDRGCGSWMVDKKIKGSRAYACSCVICRLFGSTSQASRLRIGDGDIQDGSKVGLRDHVGIDRFTGGAFEGALFQDLTLEQATFHSQVSIKNFELWQLGLLAYLVRDLACWQDGLIRLGYGKTKGYGLVEGKVEGMRLFYYGVGNGGKKLFDLGDLASPTERTTYDLKPGGAEVVDFLEPEPNETRAYCIAWQVLDDNLPKFWKKAAEAWKPENFSTLGELHPNVDSPPPVEENSP